jgi:iron complex transport system permease protein
MKFSANVKFILLLLLVLILGYLVLSMGEVKVGLWDIISGKEIDRVQTSVFYHLRLSKFATALCAGMSLSLAGLFLQSFFKNPLAGPYVLGIHSGASLMVAIYLLVIRQLGIMEQSISLSFGTIASSILGSFLVLLFLLSLSRYFKSASVLLIFGLLLSYFCGGILNIIFSLSDSGQIRDYVFWSFGSFNRIFANDLNLFLCLVIIFIIFSIPLAKRLNILSLGENYALEVGVDLKKIKTQILILSSCLSGIVTAFCGPIAFIGMMAPHLARGLFKTANHKILFPASLLFGGALGLLAELLSSGIPGVSIPLNSTLGLLAVPMIFIYFITQLKRGRV